MTSEFRVSGLTKTYGSNVVVDQLDLTIEEGEFLVLLGPSGCGKSTLLRCIAGLTEVDSGRILIDDEDVVP
ncbi:ATP-binding cassette domain-containing protein, partial [Escherichia coli]|uniref:ATP-binding cassette domain-containing protein n=1 Tax=Escherichia coli TaxID=562 RepID=UPI0034A291C5